MDLKDKIYSFMQSNNLFGESGTIIVERIHKGMNSSKISRNKISAALQELMASGTISLSGGKLVNNIKPLSGKFVRYSNGNGKIVGIENGEKVEFFVPKSMSFNAGNNAIVNYVIKDGRESEKVAQVVGIQSLSVDIVYGVVGKTANRFVFMPDDKRFNTEIDISQNEFAEKAFGKRCNIKLTHINNSNPNDRPFGEITSDSQIFGFVNSPIANIDSIIDEAGVSTVFPDGVNSEVSGIPTSVEAIDILGRKDLRHLPFITIDPATSKDMDDAVYIEKLQKNGIHYGYKLFVAIADVSHYVKPGSEIDKEAYSRGTSIYTAGGVIPMLPEKLSNGICSMNPNVDRLALVTEITIGKNGEITSYDFHNAVVNSKAKLSYEEASALYHNNPEVVEKHGEFKGIIDDLYEMEKCRDKKAQKNGALRIDGYDPTIVLSKDKKRVVDFKNENIIDSNKIIEQAMVANNTVVASFLNALNISNILRGHEQPSEHKFNELTQRLFDLGVDVVGTPTNRTYQQMLALIKEHNTLCKALNILVVQSMRKASYVTDSLVGHFALALKDYTHFTAPIRRYVDLIEHRIIKKSMTVIKNAAKRHGIDVQNKKASELVDSIKGIASNELQNISNSNKLESQAIHLSDREVVAKEITRKTNEVCAALYMQDKIGETFSGYVSDKNREYLVVTLYDENDLSHSNIIDVTIPITTAQKDNGAQTDRKTQTPPTNSRKSKLSYDVGDEINVKILNADANTRIIYGEAELEKQHKMSSRK